MRITQNQINKIIKLGKEGKKQSEISKELNINNSVVWYHIDPKRRKEKIKKQVLNFRNKSLKERRKVYRRNSEYVRDYLRERYNNDEEFREKMKKRSRDYTKRKKGVKK